MKASAAGILRRLGVAGAEIAIALGALALLACPWFALTLLPWALAAGLAGAGVLARCWLKPLKNGPINRRVALASGILAFGCAVFVCILWGEHRFREKGRLQSIYITNGPSVFEVVPEGDIVLLAARVGGLLNIFPPDQMREIRPALRREYKRMAESDAFRYCGNVGVTAQFHPDARHMLVYCPQSGTEPRGALLFLHGAGGPLALYPWLWSELAEREGLIVICPSWANCEWSQPEAARFALSCLDEVAESQRIDSARLFLAGHSQGTEGAARLVEMRPETFRGFISISGYSDSPAANAVPVLRIEGGKDPGAILAQNPAWAGARSRLLVFPDDDHFVMMRSMPAITDAVAAWMSGLPERRPD